MNAYRISAHTGPCDVEHYAQRVLARVDEADARIVRGTETLYFTVKGTDMIDAILVARGILNTNLSLMARLDSAPLDAPWTIPWNN